MTLLEKKKEKKKKENVKVLTYALDNIRIIFVILWLRQWEEYLLLN